MAPLIAKPGKNKKVGRGRPAFVPTEDQRRIVTVMVGMFCPIATVARNVTKEGIAEDTLRKYFAHEIETGKDQFVAGVKTMLAKAAQAGSVRAQTYLLDRLGGSEFAPRMRLGGLEDGPPIAINAKASVTVYLPANGREDNKAD